MTSAATKTVKKAVDRYAEMVELKKQLAEATRVLARAEHAVEQAQEDMEIAAAELEALGFDVSKDLDVQLETLSLEAEQANEEAAALLEQLQEDLGA